MPTDRKYPTVWESLHPGEPLPTDEEFRAMREQSVAYFAEKLKEDPSSAPHFECVVEARKDGHCQASLARCSMGLAVRDAIRG